MPRITITTTCQATVTEEWVLDVTDEELEKLKADEATRQPTDTFGGTGTDGEVGLSLVDGGGTYVNVENVNVEDERERTFVGFEVVADDFTNATPSVGL